MKTGALGPGSKLSVSASTKERNAEAAAHLCKLLHREFSNFFDLHFLNDQLIHLFSPPRALR